MTKARIVLTALLVAAVAAPFAAHAQDWPSRGAIRFIVPYPAGGSTDVGARVIAEHLARALGQQVVVENKSGGSGNIGFEFGAKSAPDGYTVLIAPDQVTSAPHVFKVNFDPLKDLVPVFCTLPLAPDGGAVGAEDSCYSAHATAPLQSRLGRATSARMVSRTLGRISSLRG